MLNNGMLMMVNKYVILCYIQVRFVLISLNLFAISFIHSIFVRFQFIQMPKMKAKYFIYII